jgi:hypothetical protein
MYSRSLHTFKSTIRFFRDGFSLLSAVHSKASKWA